MEKKILKIGHRGAAGYEPENTLLSFQKSIDLGVDMIELDVHLSKDKEMVVRHEYFVEGTKNGRNFITELSLAELKKLDMGKGEKIPTLQEVFNLVDRKAKINVELKGSGTALPVVKIIKKYITQNGGDYSDFLVSSFYFNELKKVRELGKKLIIGVLTIKPTDNVIKFANKIKAKYLNVGANYLTKEFIKKAHAQGFLIYVYWLAGVVENIKQAKEMDVDCICSNFPDKI